MNVLQWKRPGVANKGEERRQMTGINDCLLPGALRAVRGILLNNTSVKKKSKKSKTSDDSVCVSLALALVIIIQFDER